MAGSVGSGVVAAAFLVVVSFVVAFAVTSVAGSFLRFQGRIGSWDMLFRV